MKFRTVRSPMSSELLLQVGTRKGGRMGPTYEWNTIGSYKDEEAAREGARQYKFHYEAMNTTYQEFEL